LILVATYQAKVETLYYLVSFSSDERKKERGMVKKGGGCERLMETLEEWQELLSFPRLRTFRLAQEDLDGIVAVTRSKSNAVQLDDASMKRILLKRL